MHLSGKYLSLTAAVLFASAGAAQTPAAPDSSQDKSHAESADDKVMAPILLAGRRITEEKTDSGRRLSIEGREIAEATSFQLDLKTRIGETEIVVIHGDSSSISCNIGEEYLIAAKPGAAPEIHTVEKDDCAPGPHVALEKISASGAAEDSIVIWQGATPTTDGQIWRYDPSGALDWPYNRRHWRLEGVVKFSPQPGTTLADLRKEAPKISLYDFLENEEAYKKFRALTGDRAEDLLRMSTGPSQDVALSENGRFATTTGCAVHSGCDAELLLVADFEANALFVAFKPADDLTPDGNVAKRKKIEVFPIVGKWPSPARKQLAEWAKQWPD
jgi:hypothetical protein